MADIRHILVLLPHSARTACGIKVIAAYPQSRTMLLDGENRRVPYCIYDDATDCEKCWHSQAEARRKSK